MNDDEKTKQAATNDEQRTIQEDAAEFDEDTTVQTEPTPRAAFGPNPPVRKLPEVGPPGRSMVRTRMPDAPGGVGISIRPLPREACLPRIREDVEDTWDAPESPQTAESSDG